MISLLNDRSGRHCQFAIPGYKLYPTLPSSASKVHRFVSMVLQCTGGGILVPIFINSIPVSLSMDLYPIAIFASFLLHEHFPILRAIVGLSPYFKAALICLYECMRAYVVVKFTGAAAKAIEPSDFSFPVFGPIICGTVAGCGGAFLPLSKGLDPILAGMAQPMRTAFVGAAFYHLFLHTSLSEGVVDPSKKAQVLVAYFFIAHNIYTTFFVDAHGHGHGHGHAKSSSAGGGESKKKQ